MLQCYNFPARAPGRVGDTDLPLAARDHLVARDQDRGIEGVKTGGLHDQVAKVLALAAQELTRFGLVGARPIVAELVGLLVEPVEPQRSRIVLDVGGIWAVRRLDAGLDQIAQEDTLSRGIVGLEIAEGRPQVFVKDPVLVCVRTVRFLNAASAIALAVLSPALVSALKSRP